METSAYQIRVGRVHEFDRAATNNLFMGQPNHAAEGCICVQDGPVMVDHNALESGPGELAQSRRLSRGARGEDLVDERARQAQREDHGAGSDNSDGERPCIDEAAAAWQLRDQDTLRQSEL